MLVSAMLLSILLAGNAGSYPMDPDSHIDATCYGSNFYLGTGNVPPGSSGRETSVVNQWGVLVPGTPTALAWIAKTAAGAYWIQVNRQMASSIERAFPPTTAAWLLQTPKPAVTSDVGLPRQMSGFTVYDEHFKKIGATVAPCFTKDLPLNRLGQKASR